MKIKRLKDNSAVLRILGNAFGAVAFFGALAYLLAIFFQPEWESGAIRSTLSAEEASTLRAAAQGLDVEAVQYHVPVDYTDGSAARWWPKNESPVLAELVNEGTLPPVTERIGPEPLVMEGPEGTGNYGGTWLRLAESRSDALGFSTSRLASPALIRWSPQGYPLVPHLARDWEASDDRREWTIYLRKGIRWSDGYPVTSDDLLFTELANAEIGARPPRYLMQTGGAIGRVEKLDAHTVRFHFPEPNPLFAEILARESRVLLPAHYLAQYLPESGDPEFLSHEASRLSLPDGSHRPLRLCLTRKEQLSVRINDATDT